MSRWGEWLRGVLGSHRARQAVRQSTGPRLGFDRLENRLVPALNLTSFIPSISYSGITSIASGHDGSIWFTEATSNKIGRLTTSGQLTEYQAGLSFPAGLAAITAGPDGNMWFTERAANKIGRITPTGQITEFSTGLSLFSGVGAITTGPDGNVWFTEEAGRIGRITPSGQITEFSGLTALSGLYSITAGPDGNVWFTEVAGRIGRITRTGQITQFSTGIVPNAFLTSIAAGHDGNMWFTEADANRIGRITPAGVVTEFSAGMSMHTFPQGITAGPDGNMWFTEASGAVASVSPNGVIDQTPVLTPPGVGLGGITRGPDGNLWVVEYGLNLQEVGRLTLPHILVTGAGPGSSPLVKVYDASTGGLLRSFLAYQAGFTGGVRVAVADVNGDGVPDIITAPGPGRPGAIHVLDSVTGQLLESFRPYYSGFTGGIFVAAGDVNGDGYADIITGAGLSGPPHVKVFSGKTGAVLQNFMAYDQSFTGGVRVAAGDLNGDGRADIITSPGAGMAPVVNVYSGVDGSFVRSVVAFLPSFTGGVFVAAGDVNGDGRTDLIVGAGLGGHGHVKVYSGLNNSVLASFAAYDATFTGAVRVAALDIDGDGKADIIVGSGPGSVTRVREVSGADANRTARDVVEGNSSFTGGVFVGGA